MGHNQSNNRGDNNKAIHQDFKYGFSFTTLGLDALYGHRRDPHGYRDCLQEFDASQIIENMREDDFAHDYC